MCIFLHIFQGKCQKWAENDRKSRKNVPGHLHVPMHPPLRGPPTPPPGPQLEMLLSYPPPPLGPIGPTARNGPPQDYAQKGYFSKKWPKNQKNGPFFQKNSCFFQKIMCTYTCVHVCTCVYMCVHTKKYLCNKKIFHQHKKYFHQHKKIFTHMHAHMCTHKNIF